MKLHEDKGAFKDALLRASESLGILPALLEKDYYVTLLLEGLCREVKGLVFKGGTSLSKCYKAIDRFSEDIDLSLDSEHLGSRQKQNLKQAIVKVASSLSLSIANLEETRSRRDYNCYLIPYPNLFGLSSVSPAVKIETIFMTECYPLVEKSADSILGEWLKGNGFEAQAEAYELVSFPVTVQAKERTFVDKVFALCDYYLEGRIDKHSRHIYDLHKLIEKVAPLEALIPLVDRVKEDRRGRANCLSAQEGADVPFLLSKILEEGCYKKDYEEKTCPMLYSPCSYEEASASLEKIIASDLFKRRDGEGFYRLSLPLEAKVSSDKKNKVFKMSDDGPYEGRVLIVSNEFASLDWASKLIHLRLPEGATFELREIRTGRTEEISSDELARRLVNKRD